MKQKPGTSDKKDPKDRRKRFRVAERDGGVYDIQFQAGSQWISGIANLDKKWAEDQLSRLAGHGCPIVKSIVRVPGNSALAPAAKPAPVAKPTPAA